MYKKLSQVLYTILVFASTKFCWSYNLKKNTDCNAFFKIPNSNCKKTFPWIKQTFPECWNWMDATFCKQEFPFKEENPCKQKCLKAYNFCSMLKIFEVTKNCIHMENVRDYCQTLANKPCKKDEAPSELKDIKTCGLPLLQSESNQVIWWIKTTEKLNINITTGCALPCDSDLKMYKAGMYQVDIPIIVFGSIGMAASFFTVMSFLIDWKCQRRYPAMILFILNICFFLCLLGWIIQFLGPGDLISCAKNRERRYKEPRSDDSVWCLVSFVLIYFFSIAIACWFVVLNYAWYQSFRTMKEIKVVIQDKVKYFHLFSWSISTMLTLIVLFIGEVDAHHITNICFLSKNTAVQVFFLIVPFILCFIVGEILLVYSVLQLRKLRIDCSKFLVQKAVANISRTIHRMVIYGVTMAIALLLVFICIYIEGQGKDSFDKQYSKFITAIFKACVLQRTELTSDMRCSIQQMSSIPTQACNPPLDQRLILLHIQYLSLFLMCIVTSSWTWTKATLRIWMKVWKRRMHGLSEKQRLHKDWYGRMQKKKISPFIPPVNPNDPFQNVPLNFRHVSQNDMKRHSLPEILDAAAVRRLKSNGGRRNSEDIRSVAELFSPRRNTICSLNSIKSCDLSNMVGIGAKCDTKKLSQSLNSLQSYGHLSSAHGFINPSLRRPSTNLTLVQIHKTLNEGRKSRLSNATLAEELSDLREIRDQLYTPLSIAHRDNIVADCIPYNRKFSSSLAKNNVMMNMNDEYSWLETNNKESVAMEARSISTVDREF